MNKYLSKLAILSAIALAPSANAYDNIYFFGDSLSDSGIAGRFTTPGGKIWTEIVSSKLGLSATPALNINGSATGGNNYAIGGALAGTTNVISGIPIIPNSSEVALYLSSHNNMADPNALYSVWVGSNDIKNALTSNPASLSTVIPQAVSAEIGSINSLMSAGANHILVFSIPDLRYAPALAISNTLAQLGGNSANSYNTALFTGLKTNASGRIIPIDTYNLIREVAANPAAFGFANITSKACGTTDSNLCTTNQLVSPDAAKTYLFADGIHPTAAGHALIADQVMSIITAPAQISMLAESQVRIRQNLIRTVLTQSQISNGIDRKVDTAHIWISASGGNLSYDYSNQFAKTQGNPWQGTIGADYKLTESWLLGGALGYGKYNMDFSPNAGGFDQNETNATAYLEYKKNNWLFDSILSLGHTDIDVNRAAQLGTLHRVMKGNTDGRNNSLALFGGYDFEIGQLKHGPRLGITAQWIDIDKFTEKDTTSTSMRFGKQDRDSLITSLGYHVSFTEQKLMTYADISWNHETRDSSRKITASLNTIDLPFTLQAIKPKQDWLNLSGGVAYAFSPSITGSANLYGDVAQNDIRNYGMTLGLNLGF